MVLLELHIDGDIILFDGVPPAYDATVTAERMRANLDG